MGVNGLWKLLDPSGKPVPLETLENKVLAVDVSIWLHQVVKGFQDTHGNPLPNAHLLGLFHRICKLLFYKIKPVFVFDGGVPHFKKQTVATRNQHKSKAEVEADRVREQLLKNLVKHTALKRVLGSKTSNVDLRIKQHKESDMFELPPEKRKLEETFGAEEDTLSSEEDLHSHKNWSVADLHAIDVSSSHFKSLPADVRHDILSELKETRKQSSWGRLHEMPKESGDFSNYQMARLLKRRSIQVSLEDAEREMGGRSLSLGEMEEMLSEQGVITDRNIGMRIASDNVTRYLYVKEIGKQILAKCNSERTSVSSSSQAHSPEDNKGTENDSEPDSDLRVILELTPHKEEEVEKFEGDWSSNSEEDFVSSPQKETQSDNVNLKLAQNFIFENSGLTQQQILAVIQYQNAVKGEVHQNSEHFLSPDQPSTSGMGSKEKVLQDHTDAPASSAIQDEAAGVCSRIGAGNTAEASCSRTGVKSDTAEGSCSRTSVCNTAEASCSGTGISSTADAVCSGTVVSNTAEASCSRTGVSDPAEAVCSRTVVTNIFNENKILDKCKGTVLNDKTNEKNSSAARQGMDITESNISVHVLSSVADGQKNSNNKTEQSSSDSDSDTGFVEVTDVATLPYHSRASEKKTLEVLIQRDKICEIDDDIFADIFSAQTCKGISAMNSNIEKDTIISLSSSDDIHTDLKGRENSKFDKEHISNGINGDKEVNESKLKKEGEQLVENIVNQDDCSQKGFEVERDVSTCCDIEPEEKNGKPQVTEQVATLTLSSEELQKLQISLEEKHKDLLAERGKQERLAANITDQMYMEAQELLHLFGIPYVVAPMEAEAQCAYLDIISLTDGTITDDSDIWLFGGQKVYKNFFNLKKHVMSFKASDIKQYFKLERQHLVLLALLVGSDYTPGIQGVGPVTALEILAAFPAGGGDNSNILRGLQRFRDWWNGGMNVAPGKTSLKNKLKDVQFVEGFPSLAVADAYLHPKVDESRETFSWGSPDLTSLRDFTQQKFGWTKTKTDEILLPILKKLEERSSQMSLDSYFKVVPKFKATEGKLSKRVQQAVHCLERVGNSESEESVSDGRQSGSVSQSRKNQTDRTVNMKPENGEKRGRRKRSRGRGSSCESGTACEQSQPVEVPETSGEFIPQREKDKINALKRKLKAIEVFRMSKTGLDCTKREKKVKRLELKEAKLSNSSSSSSDPE